MADDKTNLCKIEVVSEKIANRKTKYVVFKVRHDIPIRKNNTDYNEE